MKNKHLKQQDKFLGARMEGARPLLTAGLLIQAMVTAPLAQAAEVSADKGATQLPGIVVEGEQGVITEGTGSYAADRATVGSKQPIDIKQVPQTVNVITQQRLDDGNARSLEEAAYLIPNITTTTGDGYSGSLYSRGHEVFTYNVDGAPRPFLSIYGTAPDMIFFDRVEVLSGPSGVFQGSGESVGTINLVRKRAKSEFGASGAVSYGSHDAGRIEADVTGALNEDGSVRGRIIGYGLEEDSFVNITGRERSGAYGTMEFDIGEATTLSVGAITEQQNVVRHSGLPTYTDGSLINFDSSTIIGAPWGKADSKSDEGFAELEHELANGGVLKMTARSYEREADIKSPLATTGVDPATGNFSMIAFARDFEEETQYFDVNYSAPFSFLGNRSEWTIGADVRDTQQSTLQKFASLGTQNINTFDPYSLAEPTIDYSTPGPGRVDTDTEAEEYGIYGYARLGLSKRVHLTLGGRYADYESSTLNKLTSTTTSVIEDRFVPFTGISYDFTEAVTGYLSYSEIFEAQSEQDVNGAQLKPIVGRQVELGLKGSHGKLRTQVAVYWLKDENRAEDDPNNTGFSLASGEDQTRGLEAAISGSPSPGLDLTAGYAYVNTDLDSDPTSEHNLTAWAKYSLGKLNKLYIGAGVRAASSFEALSGTVKIKAPSYGVFDALVGYHITRDVNAELFINNVLDKDYVERVNAVARGTFYGEPLSATVRLSAKF